MGAYSLSIHVRQKSSEGALDSKSSELHTTLALSETRSKNSANLESYVKLCGFYWCHFENKGTSG